MVVIDTLKVVISRLLDDLLNKNHSSRIYALIFTTRSSDVVGSRFDTRKVTLFFETENPAGKAGWFARCMLSCLRTVQIETVFC